MQFVTGLVLAATDFFFFNALFVRGTWHKCGRNVSCPTETIKQIANPNSLKICENSCFFWLFIYKTIFMLFSDAEVIFQFFFLNFMSYFEVFESEGCICTTLCLY